MSSSGGSVKSGDADAPRPGASRSRTGPATNAMAADRPPLPFRYAIRSLGRSALTTELLLCRRAIRQPTVRLGKVLRFGDGSGGRVYRETVVESGAGDAPALLVVAFRLRWVRGWGHPLFRPESLLNTPLFVGFPGFVSKLWCAHDENGVYRGFYQWNDPELADAYVRALWWVLALVSVHDSIHYVIVPGLRRDDVLAEPHGSRSCCSGPRQAWWRLVRGRTAETVNPDPVDVVVVGAGPTGLALALQSIDHGATVRIMERRRERFRPSRALIMHPRTLEVLRPLGVTDELLAKGDVAPGAAAPSLGVVCTELDRFDLADTAFPYLMLIRQADVEAVLSDALALRGVAIERDTKVVSVTAGLDDATVTLDRGTHANIACRYLVGCDGPMSIVRTAMRTTWTGAPYRQEVVLADLELASTSSPASRTLRPAKGVVFLFALGEHATWRLLATRPVDGTDLPFGQPGPPVPQDALRGLLAERSPGGDRGRAMVGAGPAPAPHRGRVPIRTALSCRRRRPYPLPRRRPRHEHRHPRCHEPRLETRLRHAIRPRSGRHRDAPRLLRVRTASRRPASPRNDQRHLLGRSRNRPTRTSQRVPSAATIGTASVPVLLRRRRLWPPGPARSGSCRVDYRHSPLACNGTGPRKGVPTPATGSRTHPS